MSRARPCQSHRSIHAFFHVTLTHSQVPHFSHLFQLTTVSIRSFGFEGEKKKNLAVKTSHTTQPDFSLMFHWVGCDTTMTAVDLQQTDVRIKCTNCTKYNWQRFLVSSN